MEKYSLTFKDQLVSKVVKVEDSQFLQLSMEPGQGLTEHKTPNHLTLVVLSGQIRFTLKNEEMVLEASDMIKVNPNAEHAVEAIDKSIVLLVLVPEVQSVD